MSQLRRIRRSLVALMLAAFITSSSTALLAETTSSVVEAQLPVETSAEIVVAVADEIKADAELLPVRSPHAGNNDNLFSGHSWYTPPPAPPVRRVAPVKRGPTAPPLPYKLLGTYEQGDDDTLYLLTKGDRVYDVAVGDTLDNTYSVDGVMNGQLMFTYLPLNTSQGLRLGEMK